QDRGWHPEDQQNDQTRLHHRVVISIVTVIAFIALIVNRHEWSAFALFASAAAFGTSRSVIILHYADHAFILQPYGKVERCPSVDVWYVCSCTGPHQGFGTTILFLLYRVVQSGPPFRKALLVDRHPAFDQASYHRGVVAGVAS